MLGVGQYWPGGQPAQTEEPAAAYDPKEQAKQSLILRALLPEAVPAGQREGDNVMAHNCTQLVFQGA